MALQSLHRVSQCLNFATEKQTNPSAKMNKPTKIITPEQLIAEAEAADRAAIEPQNTQQDAAEESCATLETDTEHREAVSEEKEFSDGKKKSRIPNSVKMGAAVVGAAAVGTGIVLGADQVMDNGTDAAATAIDKEENSDADEPELEIEAVSDIPGIAAVTAVTNHYHTSGNHSGSHGHNGAANGSHDDSNILEPEYNQPVNINDADSILDYSDNGNMANLETGDGTDYVNLELDSASTQTDDLADGGDMLPDGDIIL